MARLDTVLVEKGMAETRSKALGLIMAGCVLVNGKTVTKAGTSVVEGSEISLKPHSAYVGRGALKLEAALDAFGVDVQGKVAIDVGASTGGFTEIMLSRGAARVYAVDVGHNQLHWRLRSDPRVICMEGVNARLLRKEDIPEACDIATFDVSFISLKLVVLPVLEVLKRPADIIALIKPQFEAGRDQVGKGGVIRDPEVIDEVIADISAFFGASSLAVDGVIPSPVKGAKGNQEYLIHARREGFR